VTCGDSWIFLAYQAPNGDYAGGYSTSPLIELGKEAEGLELIFGILLDWIEHTGDYDQEYFDYVSAQEV